jgi:D-glycero-D-manno-heptose 1,7-bisphosphate phosphatase
MADAARPGVILDRDGTLIDVVRDDETGTVSVAFHPNQLVLLPGVVDGLRALAREGFVLAMATNQPGPAKGQFSREAVERTNRALAERLLEAGISLAATEVCMHHPEGGVGGDPSLVRACECRKPKPGMLLSLIQRLNLDPAASWMVGDSAGDVDAARAAGLNAALVFAQNRCELCPLRGGPPRTAEVVAPRFDQMVERLLEWRSRRGTSARGAG